MTNEKFLIKVNDTETSLDREQIASENMVSLPGNRISLISSTRSFTSSIIDIDPARKAVFLKMDGRTYEARIETGLDIQLKTMGFGNATGKVLKEIKAPMPGMVLEVNVNDGESVDAGAKLLVLEAMKMENVISLPAAGKIKKVLVKKGEAVQKNQVMIELDNG